MGNFWYKPSSIYGMKSDEFMDTNHPKTAPVYMLKTHHTPGETCSQKCSEHWIVVVDLEKKSTDTHIIGLQLHLVRLEDPQKKGNRIPTDKMVLYPLKSGTFEKASLPSWEYKGDIQNLGGHTPYRWAFALWIFAFNNWSSGVNCQQFARKLLRDLSLQCDEGVTGDIPGELIDCYCPSIDLGWECKS